MSSPVSNSIPPRSIVCIADDDQPISLIERVVDKAPTAIAGVMLGGSLSESSKSIWRNASQGCFPLVDQWESWLGDDEIRLVIVSTRNAEQLDALRQLAGVGKSVVIYPQLEHELSLPYELSLLVDQTSFDVFPVRPLREQGSLGDLQKEIRSGGLGAGVHLQLERKVPLTPATDRRLLSIHQIESCWVEDAAILDFLAGPFGQLTATRAGEVDRHAPLSQIIVGSSDGPQAVWTCSPSEEAEWRLIATGQVAQLEILRRGSGNEIRVTRRFTGAEPTVTSEVIDSSRATLEQISDFFSGVRHPQGLRELIRSFELLDASRRSLKRRRTIDLYYDAPTERGNFKTQMSAIGCGVLMYTLFAFLFSLGIGELFRQIYGDPEHPGQVNLPPWGSLLMIVIRVVTFAPLGMFLALQFLMYFARSSRERE